jgi:hypothetical protein
MSADRFDDLIRELPRIAEVVNQFSSDSVQQQAYEALVAALLGNRSGPKRSGGKGKASAKKKGKSSGVIESKQKPDKVRKRKSGIDSYSIVPDLNLRPKKGKSLADFVAAKVPKTNEERFAVMIYYLQNELKLEKIGPNYIYTCFKDLKQKVPPNLRVVLGNAARRKGWFTSSVDDLKLTTRGENFVEHDLPHKKA